MTCGGSSRAQLERIRSAGIAVSHVDTHQHTHLWPAVAGVLVELARQDEIRAVRTPRSQRLLPIGFGVNVLSGRLRRRVGRAGLATTDDYTGLDEAGSFDQARFERSLTTRSGPGERARWRSTRTPALAG